MKKIEELINDLIHKWIEHNWLNDLSHPQVYIMAKGIEDIINSAVLEKDIKIDILEQEVDSWKNVFSKELVEEQKAKDAEIASVFNVQPKFKEEYTVMLAKFVNTWTKEIAKAIREQK